MPRSLKGPANRTADGRSSGLPASIDGAALRDPIGRMGVEIWRLQFRLKDSNDARLRDSADRLGRAFSDLGGSIEDRVGERFAPGTTAEILHQPPAADATSEWFVVIQTVRPRVMWGSECVVVPQVMLGLVDKDAK